MRPPRESHKRVILVYWKDQRDETFEVFSNLKIFCLSYPQFNYNTLNNYLSKGKVPYENAEVKVERKTILTQPKEKSQATYDSRGIIPVVRKAAMKDAYDRTYDLEYWLSQPAEKRLEAVTFIIAQSLQKGQRLDRTAVHHKRLGS